MTIERTTTIPTDGQIMALHERYAPTGQAFELVYTHCRIVCDVAEHLLDRHHLDLDVALVRAGCLLHDIGVYRLYDATGQLDHGNYVRHGVLGHELLRDLGYPEPPTFVTAASYAAGVRRFGADKAVRFAALVEKYGEPDLPPLARRYGHRLT